MAVSIPNTFVAHTKTNVSDINENFTYLTARKPVNDSVNFTGTTDTTCTDANTYYDVSGLTTTLTSPWTNYVVLMNYWANIKVNSANKLASIRIIDEDSNVWAESSAYSTDAASKWYSVGWALFLKQTSDTSRTFKIQVASDQAGAVVSVGNSSLQLVTFIEQ